MWGIEAHDVFLVFFLIFLEGILSIDNALVLALLARHLPPQQQRKALTYGLAGAVIFRLLALLLITQIIRLWWVKFAGAAYLLFISGKHFLFKSDEKETDHGSTRNFWKVVVLIELTDIAFAVDSILAAVALTPKFWVVFVGGVLGIVMMRFAATVFIKVLDRFPRFEDTAYLLVSVIGAKLMLEAFKPPGIDFHSPSNPAFWIFWALMLACILFGFKQKKK